MEQFRRWGSAGPEFPPPPAGWAEVKAGDDLLPPAAPTAEEQRRGYVLFARDPMVGIAPDSLPAASERATVLSIFAAQGEYEPVSFAVHALADLKDVRVVVSDLRAPGAAIPAEQVDVRVARSVRSIVDAGAKTYRVVPFLLERRQAFAVARGQSAQVWLTIKVPEGAKPGDYGGTVSVTASGGQPASLSLRLRVLPFSLPQVPIEMAMSFPNPSPTDAGLESELVDLREHGINAMEPMIAVQIKSRDQVFGDDDVAATREACKRRMDAIRRVFGPWRFPVTFEVGNQLMYYWDVQKGWFVCWPHGEKIDQDLLKAIAVVRDLAKAEHWPALRCYAIDEAGAHWQLDEAVYYHRLIKERAPDIGSYTTIGGGMAMGHDEIGQLAPYVDLLSTNRFTPDIAKALIARPQPFGVYNGCRDTAGSARFFFGFYGWKTGATQILQWAYSTDETGFWQRGLRDDGEGFVYHAPDGPLPSLLWEGVREGIDDYRLVDLLWRQVAAARASRKPGAAEAADHAVEVLRGIMARIPWTYQAMTYEGRTPPPSPSTLRKWRWQVAQEVMKLQALAGPVPSVAPKPTPRPNTLALPWPAPEKDASTLGPEILPPSGFEDGLKPWRVETWSSKATNALDPAEHHSGKQSLRVDVPADTPASGVTVVDWPTWVGGEVLKLSLEGSRIYEFSAWVRVKGRGSLPVMRFGLPDGAAVSTREGQDPATPDGWQRIWARVDMAVKAQPTYIAVWIQGPGTVWVDDLSLREVTPPPLRVSLDQDEYDGADHAGSATVSVGRQMVPSHIRFSLVNEDGRPAAEMTVPFRVTAGVGSAAGPHGSQLAAVTPTTLRTCRFGFEPAALPVGAYQARVDLLDGAGAVLAGSSAPFRVTAAAGR